MSNPETVTYGTDNLIAGEIYSGYKDAKAGTYKRGQPLGRLNSSNVYEAFNAAGAGGVEVFKAVCAKDVVLAAQGKLPTYISGSEVLGRALKNSDGTAFTVTTAVIENAQDNGILIKE